MAYRCQWQDHSLYCVTLKLPLSHRDPKHSHPGAGERQCVQIGEGTKFTWVLIKHQFLMPLGKNAGVWGAGVMSGPLPRTSRKITSPCLWPVALTTSLDFFFVLCLFLCLCGFCFVCLFFTAGMSLSTSVAPYLVFTWNFPITLGIPRDPCLDTPVPALPAVSAAQRLHHPTTAGRTPAPQR